MKKTQEIARRVMVLVLTLGLLVIGTGFTAKQAMAQGQSNRTFTRIANVDHDCIVVLGLGAGPVFYPDRNNTGFALFHNGQAYLIDCGTDTPEAFASLGVPYNKVAGIFFTHYHFDHTAGYADLLTRAFMTDKGTQLNLGAFKVYGPLGLKDLTDGLMIGFENGYNLHNWSHSNFSYKPAPVITEFNPNVPQNGIEPIDILTGDPDMLVQAIEVDHDEVFGTCYAYRFKLLNEGEETGKVVVFSGDRANYNARRDPGSAYYSPGGPSHGKELYFQDGLTNEDFQEAFKKFAENANVLVHEAAKSDWADRIVDPNLNSFQNGLYWHLIDAHTDVSEIPKIAKDANVGAVVLHHYGDYTDGNLKAARSVILSGVLKANAKVLYKGRIIAPLELDVIGF